MAQTTVVTADDAGDGLRIGRVISRSFEILFRHFVLFFLVTAIPTLPYLLLPQGNAAAMADPKELAAKGWLLALGGLISLIAQAMVLYGTFQDMRGKPFGVADSLKKGLARFFPIIGLGFCQGVALILGFICLVVPAIILMCMFFVSVPACVIEKAGPIESLKRSAALTKGHRWKIFGLLLLLGIAGGIVGAVIGGVSAVAGSLVFTIVMFLWRVVIGAFSAILVAVLYHDLRAAQEGIDTDKMAAVFD